MRWGVVIVWVLGSLLWLSDDRLLRDGDEEGHVGAAELMRLHLDGGDWATFAHDAWQGELGEYPPLYPALVGAWWWICGSGQPGSLPIRSVNLLGLLLGAWATSQLAGRLVEARSAGAPGPLTPKQTATLTATILVLSLPLGNGLARHFMPEGLLLGWVALAVAVAAWANDRQTHFSLILLGGALGTGLLIKQTFAPLALLPVLVAGVQLRSGWLTAGSVAALVAGPWYALHWADQTRYVSQSVQGGHAASMLDQAWFYPASMATLIGGPVAVCAALLGTVVLWRRSTPTARRALAIGLAWLLGLVFLALIPRKYPRLAAPIAPALALLGGVGAAHLGRRAVPVIVCLVAGGSWLVWMSVHPVPSPSWVPVVDEKCPQQWIRPANPDDMGLQAIVDALRTAPPGPLSVAHAPELPCAVQTTHPWMSHIEPYLRRSGVEREVRTGSDPRAAVQVTFLPAEDASDTDRPIPSLGLALRIETR